MSGAEPVRLTWRESPRAVKALLAGVFVNKLGGFLQVFLVLFLTGAGFSTLQAGVALGAYGAGSVAGVLAGGVVSDRFGARRAIVVSLGLSAALLVAIAYLRWYPGLLAVVTLAGAASQVYRPAAASLMAALTPRPRQVMVFAMSRLALNLGTTVAPLLGAALAAVSYEMLFWGEALAATAYAIVTLFAVVPAGTARRPPDRAPGYRAVLADRRYVMFLVATFVNATVYMQYVSTLPLAVGAAGLAPFWYSVLVALNGFIVITCELLMTKLVARFPPRRVIATGFTLLGAGLACYAIPGGVLVFLVGTVIWTLAEIVEGPTMVAYPAQAGPAFLRGRYIGAAHAMFGLGAAVGPVAGVALWNSLGSMMWVLCGAASLLAIIPGRYGLTPAGVQHGAAVSRVGTEDWVDGRPQ